MSTALGSMIPAMEHRFFSTLTIAVVSWRHFAARAVRPVAGALAHRQPRPRLSAMETLQTLIRVAEQLFTEAVTLASYWYINLFGGGAD
jgi:hypothetical protein